MLTFDMSSESIPDYSSVVSVTGFLRPRASRSVASFQEHLLASHRILALLGAGLSAPSGLPTFRSAGEHMMLSNYPLRGLLKKIRD